jgi:heme-degrading monooxygenase HmoA
MTFSPEKVSEFTEMFEERKPIIRSFRGCEHLELWQDTKDPNVFFTYSKWQSEKDLDHYRFSEFFKDTWIRAKGNFSAKAEAWSLNANK